MRGIRTKYDLAKLTPEQLERFQVLILPHKRQLIIQRCRGICELCRQCHGDDLHHKTYARLGRELPDDLAFICRACHEALHKIEMGWVGMMGVHHGKGGTWPKTEAERAALVEESVKTRKAYATSIAAEVYWHNRANGIRSEGFSYEGC